MKTLYKIVFFLITSCLFAQSTFDYQIQLNPVTIPNFPGITYAFAQHNGNGLLLADVLMEFTLGNHSTRFLPLAITQ
jgi:hypothetical protein